MASKPNELPGEALINARKAYGAAEEEQERIKTELLMALKKESAAGRAVWDKLTGLVDARSGMGGGKPGPGDVVQGAGFRRLTASPLRWRGGVKKTFGGAEIFLPILRVVR